MSANLVNSNTPMTTLGMLRTRKTRTTVPTILASWRSRLLERLDPGLKNILKLRVASRKRGARPVVVRGWTDWYRIRKLQIWWGIAWLECAPSFCHDMQKHPSSLAALVEISRKLAYMCTF